MQVVRVEVKAFLKPVRFVEDAHSVLKVVFFV